MKIKIPKKFKLYGKTIKVLKLNDLIYDADHVGMNLQRHDEILLQKRVKGIAIKKQQMEESFFHELTHRILRTMKKDELNKNENFVEHFSSLLYQALKTAKD